MHFRIDSRLSLGPSQASRQKAVSRGPSGPLFRPSIPEDLASARQSACEACDHLKTIAEITPSDGLVSWQICSHPKCGCPSAVKRAHPWLNLLRCPLNAWPLQAPFKTPKNSPS